MGLNFGLHALWLIALVGGLVAAFLLCLALGSVNIPLDQVIRVLLGGSADRESWSNIILKVRLPKGATAALAGSALGFGGLMMQTLFHNPLADPFVLGINSGASLGVAAVVLAAGSIGGTLMAGFGLRGDLLLTVAAALGSGITLMLVLAVAARVRGSTTLLIIGLMFGALATALVSLLLYFAVPERIQGYINWTFGSFGSVAGDQLPILAGAVAIGLVLAFGLTKPLNALLLGDETARSLGLRLRASRLAIVTATALLAESVTAFCGPIGFIGIAVPHLCRGLLGTSDHRLLVPAAMLIGAMVALAAALIAESPGNNLVLPLNAVTALIGAPVVIAVTLRKAAQS